MDLHFNTDLLAQKAGWTFVSDFREIGQTSTDKKYVVQAERKMGSIQQIFQKIFVYLLIIITLTLALNSERVSHWKKEADKGQIIATIYCKEISPNQKVVTNLQPEIVDDAWGTISVKVNGKIETFNGSNKDVVITPNNAQAWRWDWNLQTPMRHVPGIRKVDIDHFILSQPQVPDVVILSKGRGHGDQHGYQRENPGPGILEVDSSLDSYLKSKGVQEVYILKTAAAIAKYNELSKKGVKTIAALIHTTC